MHISVIVVSWNVGALLERCLASVLAEAAAWQQGTVDVVVVDNASTDRTPELIRERFPTVTLLVNETNQGFAAACNRGIAVTSGDAVLLCNPDTELQPGALPALAAALVEHPEAGVVGPVLLNPDGSTQSSRRRFPTLATALLESTIVQQHIPGLPHFRSFYCLDRADDQEQQVDWLVGACLLLRRTALKRVGPLDERFFMYFEETDWCLRARHAGWQAWYLPRARVLHHGGKSSEQYIAKRHHYFMESKQRFYAKHFGPWVGHLVRWALLVNYAALMLEDALKMLLGHKLAMRRRRIAELASALKWGVRR